MGLQHDSGTLASRLVGCGVVVGTRLRWYDVEIGFWQGARVGVTGWAWGGAGWDACHLLRTASVESFGEGT